MFINAEFIDHIDEVPTLVDTTDGQFPAFFRLLKKAARLGVPSLLGWRVGFTVRGQPVNVTFARYPLTTVDVRASLHIPLADVLTQSPHGYVTFFAGQPHAFLDFAADISRALHLPLSRFPLDQHLEPLLLSSSNGPDDGLTTAVVRRSQRPPGHRRQPAVVRHRPLRKLMRTAA